MKLIALPGCDGISPSPAPVDALASGVVLEHPGRTLDYTFTPSIIYHGVTMALNIKNTDVERLAAEVARLTGESKTEAIRRALDERRRRLTRVSTDDRRARVLRFLKKHVWPTLPKAQVGRRLSRAEEDEILGYGPGGV